MRIAAAGLIALALAVTAVASLGGGPAGTAGVTVEAVTLSEFGLLSRAQTIEPSPYWVGRRPRTAAFELERDAEGNLYVRYLSAPGQEKDRALAVATYPVAEARERLEAAATSAGEALLSRPGLVMLGSGRSYSAYAVFEERPELQVEVYSPRRGEAARLVRAGAVTPLHWTPLS